MREELLLVTAPTHPLARKKQVTPQDLIGQPFVLFEAGSNSRKAIEAFFVREQISPKVVTETENVEIIKALVMVGMGWRSSRIRPWRARCAPGSCSAPASPASSWCAKPAGSTSASRAYRARSRR
jgi:DNA-binding transcriptional LysR family regulator